MATTWNLSLIMADSSDTAIEAECAAEKAAHTQFATTWKGRTDWLTEPVILRQALDSWEQLAGSGGTAGYYLSMAQALDSSDQTIQARLTRLEAALSECARITFFFEEALGKVSAEQQEVFLTAPVLAPYQHYLQRVFTQAKYVLSESEEYILSRKSVPARSHWKQLLDKLLYAETAAIPFAEGERVVGFAELPNLLSHPEVAVREAAAAAITLSVENLAPVAAAEMTALLVDHQINDELRKRERPDEGRHTSDDIDSASVDALLSAVSQQNTLAHQFYQLKAKLLGLPTLDYTSRVLPWHAEESPTYTWEESLELVSSVLGELHPEFGQILQQFVANGQVDVFPKPGKRGGAFCAYGTASQPVMVLLNHTNRQDDVTTLAHEMGHAINDVLIARSQNNLNLGTPLATAEVASTFMEDFVLQRLAAKASPRQRLELLMSRLDDDIASTFRQVACYRFEQALHTTLRAEGNLSPDRIGELFREHMQSYLGDAVEMDETYRHWWVYWSHIRTHFYVYSYASGLLIAKALQARVRADANFMQQVTNFLSTGRSKSPHQAFMELDIDISDTAFWQAGLGEIERTLTEATNLASELGLV